MFRRSVSSVLYKTTSYSSSMFIHRAIVTPYHQRSLSTAVGSPSSVANDHPSLVRVPSLPFVGSTIAAYSGIPPIDLDNFIDSWRRLHQAYGPFYSVGVPGIGSGVNGTAFVVRDPHEVNKILQKESTYPSGLVEKEWPLVNWLERKQYSSIGLIAGRGAEWKRLRSFMQKDLLAPTSAKAYLPAICAGAALSSKRAPEFPPEKFGRFMNYSAFDMFMCALLGQPDEVMTPEDHARFLNAGVDGLSGVFDIMRSPLQVFAWKLGVTTPMMRLCYSNLDTVHEIAHKRLSLFKKQMEQGDLTEEERNSYFVKMMERQPGSDVTEQEVMEICIILMLAAADTTAAKTAWNVLQLALNQSVQEVLYEQLHQAVQEEGSLPAVLSGSKVPLLSAFVRETHRCTPAVPGDILKTLSAPTDVHGVTLPEGSTIFFDSLTVPMDPALVESPLEFKPERWFKEAVEARKGTPSSIIDHPFYSGPFSQGARRCPGSRVANIEVQSIISQLVLDWKIEGPSDVHWKDVPSHLGTIVTPRFPAEMRFVPRS